MLPDRSRKVLLLLASLLAGFGLSEIVFRSFCVTSTVPATDHDFERIVESTWPRPVGTTRATGTVRVLGLGDSFGVNGGPGNFHYLVARSLTEGGHPVEVVNFSVGGYSLFDESLLLDRFGERYRPDVVLQSVFMGNDFIVPKDESHTYRGIPVDVTRGTGALMPQNWLLPQWIGRFATALRDKRLAETEEAGAATFSREKFLWIEAVRMSTFHRPSRDVVAWPDVTRALDGIRRKAESMGATYVLVAHPDQVQIEGALRAEVEKAFGFKEGDYDMDLPAGFLAAYAASRHVPFVDLTPAFRSEGAGGGLYLPLDTHYNAKGNALAARLIEPVLEQAIEARGSPMP